VVVSEHYTGFLRGLVTGYDRLTARVAFSYADLVAPVSHDLARHLQALEPRARIRVVENVVDTDVFHPPPDRSGPANGARLLCVAALAEKKGHRDLLQALAALRRDGQELVLDLVGDGELRAQLQALVRDLGLSEVVRFRGELPKPQVAELMRQVDLFVLPSRFENLPVVLIEAMASGLPAVATSVGGVPELLDTAGQAMELCPPQDPSALASAVVRVLERRDAIDASALAARARRRFGYDAIGRTWTEIYEELRGGDRRI
jgi:glycosyltransferase involved in cell wall biosynthesis